jgi:hypothetical protein
MTTDYELYLNFKFLTTYFFLLLLNNQQKHCVSCKVIVISRYIVTNVATCNTVASLLYFIHTMFWWSYTIDHCTFILPGYRLESPHMSVVKFSQNILIVVHAAVVMSRKKVDESVWRRNLWWDVFPLLAWTAQLVHWQVKGFNGRSFIPCSGKTFSLC